MRLTELTTWFDTYVNGFFNGDGDVDKAIDFKRVHSIRVREEALAIAQSLDMDSGRCEVVQGAALLHDVGRFEQYSRFRTFRDHDSLDHGKLGAERLTELDVLAQWPESDRTAMIASVRWHCVRTVPQELTGWDSRLCRIVRDADKLDIYLIVMGFIDRFLEDPKTFEYERQLSSSLEVSPEILADALSGRTVDYAKVRTAGEVLVTNIGWIYDINFIATLTRVRERGYLDRLFSLLPDRPDIHTLRERIHRYMDERMIGIEA